MEPEVNVVSVLPSWLPAPVRRYLGHTGEGVSLREIARREGLAASTVMRQIRRYEARRDDPLVDEALEALCRTKTSGSVSTPDAQGKDIPQMTAPVRQGSIMLDEAAIQREGRRILRRLAEPGAVLAIAPNMEKAVVLRASSDGRMVQTAVLERALAQAFALKDWISVRNAQGRLTSYEISASGRAALKALIDEEDRRRMSHHAAFGLADGGAIRIDGGSVTSEVVATRKSRFALTESPIAVLARRREKDGTLFLSPDLVQAAERLREDFELAQMASRDTQIWDRFLSDPSRLPATGMDGASGAARERVAAALRDLGPGLGDVVLRVCCYLEGLEVAERRMGWAARSGKIVLRIALQRLRRHYVETYGRSGPLIG